MLWSSPAPAEKGRRLREEFALLFMILLTDLSIIIGPALVILFDSPVAHASSIASSMQDAATIFRWILLAVDFALAGIVITMVGTRIRAGRTRPG